MEKTLKIYYTSDTHGRIFPEDSGAKPCLAKVFAEYQKDENTLVLDGGDTLQGSPLLRYLWNTNQCNQVLSTVMNTAKLDYYTLGNHDFNYGYAGLAGYVNSLSATCLCANVVDTTVAQQVQDAAKMQGQKQAPDTPTAQQMHEEEPALNTQQKPMDIRPYAIHTLGNGLKIGIVGIVTDYVNLWEAEENLVGLSVTDPFLAAKSALEEIQSVEKDLDYTICIYHGGFEDDIIGICQDAFASMQSERNANLQQEKDADTQSVKDENLQPQTVNNHSTQKAATEAKIQTAFSQENVVNKQLLSSQASEAPTKTTENIGCKICRELGFDLLLTAHQHMEQPLCMLHGTAVLQLPPNAEKYAALEIAINETGKKQVIKAKHIAATATPDAALLKQMQPLRGAAAEWLSQPAGTLAKAVPAQQDKVRLATEASPLVHLANFAQLQASGAEVAITSLPNQAVSMPQQMTIGDVLTAYPFPNAVITLAVPGAVLAQGIARSASYIAQDETGALCVANAFMKPKEEHYNYDFFAGVSYSILFGAAQQQGVVTDITVNGEVLDPARIYRVVMSDYRATGTGGYEFFANCPRIASHPCDVQALILQTLADNPDFEIPTLSAVNVQVKEQ